MGRVSIGFYEESLGWFLPINAVARAFVKDPPWGGGSSHPAGKRPLADPPPLGLWWLRPKFPNKNFMGSTHKKLQKNGACGTNIIFSLHNLTYASLSFKKNWVRNEKISKKNNCCNDTFDKEDVRLVTKILLTQKDRENYEPI